MAERTINTRIQSRYDTYTNWTSGNAQKLLKGEIAVVSVTAGQLGANYPARDCILFKVGDGTHNFVDLPWLTGLAGDVYDWAKAPTKPSYNYSEIGLTPTIGNGTITIKQGSSSQTFSTNQTDNKTITLTDNNTTYTFAEGGTNGAFSVTPSGGSASSVKIHGLGSAAYTASTAYATAAQGKKADSALQEHQTVSLASGTTNGTLKLTVGASTTDNIKVTGLGAAAYKGVDTAVPNQASSNLVTSDAVKSYVANKVAGAVEYIGTFDDPADLTTHYGNSQGDFARASANFEVPANRILGATTAVQVHAGDLLIYEDGEDDAATWSIIHGELDKNTWTANSKTADGYVTKGNGQVSKVWKTDASGNPAWRDDTDTVASLWIGNGTAKSNAAQLSPYLKLFNNNTKAAAFQITGSGTVSVNSDANGNITIAGRETTIPTNQSITFADGNLEDGNVIPTTEAVVDYTLEAYGAGNGIKITNRTYTDDQGTTVSEGGYKTVAIDPNVVLTKDNYTSTFKVLTKDNYIDAFNADTIVFNCGNAAGQPLT